LPAERKKRWCGGCAKAHAGAVDVNNKKCEGCQLKGANFGLPAEGKARWCSGCAKRHAGAVVVNNKKCVKCEGCGLKQASFGLPGEGKKQRWCGGCAKAHKGAQNNKKKKCEGCGLNVARIGLSSDGKKRRWCVDCAPETTHDGRGRTQAEGSPQKKRKATGPPLTVSDQNVCLGSKYRLAIGNPYEAATQPGWHSWGPSEPGSGCGGRWQAAKKAAPKKLEAANKKAAPKKQKAAKKKAAPKKK
jgi:hypothetical protein